MVDVQGDFISWGENKNQQHDFPRHHTVTSTSHFSFITLYQKKKKINRNTPKHTPTPLKLANLKLRQKQCFVIL